MSGVWPGRRGQRGWWTESEEDRDAKYEKGVRSSSSCFQRHVGAWVAFAWKWTKSAHPVGGIAPCISGRRDWGGLLVRKAMTNLESILKSKDITLPTKVQIVKAMVFPVVMYGCES